MSEEQEKIADVVFETQPETTWYGKAINYIKIAFATKKVVMAGYAMFFGATVAAGNYAAEGMTADQVAEKDKMQQTITTLESKVIDLEILIVELNQGVDHEHDAVVIPAPVFIPHDHPDIVALTGVFGHTHDEIPPHEHLYHGEGPIGPPGPPGPPGKDGEDRIIEVEKEQQLDGNGIVIDGKWIDL